MEYVKETKVPLVSVIVPVYNVEVYLEQCLSSIRMQTLQEIEIIVIDDGSADRSGEICDAFAATDLRFRVIHKKNEGLSAARNDGLDLATAEYIMFVDSDDWVEPEFCEVPYRIALENDADLVAFGIRHYNNKGKAPRQMSFPAAGVISKEAALTRYWAFVNTAAWNKLYRRRLFDDIRYPVGHLSEDTAVTHRVIYRASKIFLLDRTLYNYRLLRPGSITGERSRQLLEDSTRYNLRRIDDLRTWGYDYLDEEKKLALSYLAWRGRDAEYSPRFIQILRECECFPRGASWRQKVMLRIFRISPILFDWIAVLMGRRDRAQKRSGIHSG